MKSINFDPSSLLLCLELGLPILKSRDIPLDYQAFRYKVLAQIGYLSCRRPGMYCHVTNSKQLVTSAILTE